MITMFPATFLCPDPDKSRPRAHILFLYILHYQQPTILVLVLPSGLLHSGFFHNTVQNSRPSHTCKTLCKAHSFELISLTKFHEENRQWSFSLCSFLQSCRPLSPNFKYFLQHPILKYPKWDRTRCTPQKSNTQYVSTSLLIVGISVGYFSKTNI
jgi:hypothetical protein